MDYYNINSNAFFQQTYDIDMQSLYQPFLKYLPEKSLKEVSYFCLSEQKKRFSRFR